MSNFVVEYLIPVASLLTALAAFINIWVFKKENRKSYQPQIFPENKVYYYYLNEQGIPFFDNRYGNKEIDFYYATHNIPVYIRNVGRGAATGVKVEWVFDNENMIKELTIGDRDLISENDKEQKNYSFLLKEDHQFGFSMAHCKKFSKDVASIIPSEEIEIAFPETVANFFAFKFLKEERKNNECRLSFIVEDIFIRITYRDITGKKIKQTIPVKIHAYVHFSQNRPVENYHGSIKVEYI